VRYLAVTLGLRRITVNSVSPGGVLGPPDPVEGGVLRALPGEVQEAILAWHEGGWTPMRRLATPTDVGGAVLLLCTEEAGFVTGQVLHLDGGASLMDGVFSKRRESRSTRSRRAAAGARGGAVGGHGCCGLCHPRGVDNCSPARVSGASPALPRRPSRCHLQLDPMSLSAAWPHRGSCAGAGRSRHPPALTSSGRADHSRLRP
jgi:Enoyl-(Acyl carrier protein) reductase